LRFEGERGEKFPVAGEGGGEGRRDCVSHFVGGGER